MKFRLPTKREFIEFGLIVIILLTLAFILRGVEEVNQMYYKYAQNVIYFIGLLCIVNFIFKQVNYKIFSYGKKTKGFDSNSEKIIADFLRKNTIEFEKHKKILVKDKKVLFWNVITVTPDFYLPNYDIYIEFYGLADKNNYEDWRAKTKTKLYHENKLKIIPLYPRHLNDLNSAILSKLREV